MSCMFPSLLLEGKTLDPKLHETVENVQNRKKKYFEANALIFLNTLRALN